MQPRATLSSTTAAIISNIVKTHTHNSEAEAPQSCLAVLKPKPTLNPKPKPGSSSYRQNFRPNESPTLLISTLPSSMGVGVYWHSHSTHQGAVIHVSFEESLTLTPTLTLTPNPNPNRCGEHVHRHGHNPNP